MKRMIEADTGKTSWTHAYERKGEKKAAPSEIG